MDTKNLKNICIEVINLSNQLQIVGGQARTLVQIQELMVTLHNQLNSLEKATDENPTA